METYEIYTSLSFAMFELYFHIPVTRSDNKTANRHVEHFRKYAMA